MMMLWLVVCIRLSPMLRVFLGVLSCLVSCHIIFLQIHKSYNFISNHTNILTYPYIFHIITYFLFKLNYLNY
ncbi:hypothetical protein Hanom_Chr05g00442471 [Helianthus anomalus]